MSARSQQREFEARTQRALQFIADTMRARGYPPSRQAGAAMTGTSLNPGDADRRASARL